MNVNYIDNEKYNIMEILYLKDKLTVELQSTKMNS